MIKRVTNAPGFSEIPDAECVLGVVIKSCGTELYVFKKP